MSYTLVDHHGVTVGRYAGARGVPMIQVTVSDDQGGATVASMTLHEFHTWLCDLFGGMFEAARRAGDPPDPRSLAALERALNIDWDDVTL